VPDRPPGRWPPGRAVAAGIAVGLVVGFAFALRAGAIAGPAVALLLYLRVPTRLLVAAALAALAVVVPALYLAYPGRDPGGYSTYYAVAHLAAHWVAVGAVVLLALALARTLRAARG
jgi:hypothetical protein